MQLNYLRSDVGTWMKETKLYHPNIKVYSKVDGNISFRNPKIFISPVGIITNHAGNQPLYQNQTKQFIEQLIDVWNQTGRPLDKDGMIFNLWDNNVYQTLQALTTTFLVTAIASNQSWSVPSDWNNNNNYVDVIGGGGRCATGNGQGNGGGGGGFSRKYNITLSGTATYRLNPSSTYPPDVWFNGTTFNGASVAAKGGSDGGSGNGAGGQASSGIGDIKYSGGAGGIRPTGSAGRGGGGAAGPNGDGGEGGFGGGAGDAGFGGNGGNFGGGDGDNGSEYDSDHGCGGGGGGNDNQSQPGGQGGLYGAGAGAGGFGTAESDGKKGMIVIFYTPGSANPQRMFMIF